MGKTSDRIKLTKRAADAAEALILPNGKIKQKVYWDTELGGFGLVVSTKAKSFIVQKDIAGRSVRHTIGRYGTFTANEARKEAREILVRMTKGENPNQTKRQQAAQGITLREALALKIKEMEANNSSKKTIDGYKYNLEKYLPTWLDRSLMSITREQSEKKHKKIAYDIEKGKHAKVITKKGTTYTKQRTPGSGRSTANAVMRVFSACWNRAAKLNENLPICPKVAVTLFPEKSPEYAIKTKNLSAWYSAVLNLRNTIRRDYLIFALFTALRRTSVAETQWKHINWEDQSIYIPNPKGGTKKEFYLPLSNFLIDLLKQRKAENEQIYGEKNPWIFPAESKSGHIEEPRSNLLNPDNPEELLDIKWNPHSLRRTFTTVAESLNISPYTLKLLLNHQLPKSDVTAGYLEHELERLHEAMEAITKKLLTLCGVANQENGARVAS